MPGAYVHWCDEQEECHRRDLVDKLFIGRLCRGVDADKCIQIKRPTVSRDHAVIQSTSLGIEITDLSTNGTWLNGVRMTQGSSRFLADGDFIEIGQVRLEIRITPGDTPKKEDRWDIQTTIRPAEVRVTSLVADVRGFSGICQASDSQAAYAMMQELFSRFSDIVTSFGGTIKDFAGDAIFAFWEHPEELSCPQALRACRAAIAQSHQVQDVNATLGREIAAMGDLRLGWGLTTGRATLSHYGVRHADLALVGDAVNLAFRLSAVAAKEVDAGIVLCRQTAELVRSQIGLRNLGRVMIKGRRGLEEIYGIG